MRRRETLRVAGDYAKAKGKSEKAKMDWGATVRYLAECEGADARI